MTLTVQQDVPPGYEAVWRTDCTRPLPNVCFFTLDRVWDGLVVINGVPVVPPFRSIFATSGQLWLVPLEGSDPDFARLTFTIVDGPDHGALVRGEFQQTYWYQSVDGFVGIDSLTYRVSDEWGSSATGTIQIVLGPVPGSTPPGESVEVALIGYPLTVTYDAVFQGGGTTVTPLTNVPPLPPDRAAGEPPILIDVSTTAFYGGNITLCLSYAGTTFADEAAIGLYHREWPLGRRDDTSGHQQQNRVRRNDLAVAVRCPRAARSPGRSLSPGRHMRRAGRPVASGRRRRLVHSLRRPARALPTCPTPRLRSIRTSPPAPRSPTRRPTLARSAMPAATAPRLVPSAGSRSTEQRQQSS